MLRELTANELMEYNAYDGEIEALLREIAIRMKNGEKIIVKEKTTQSTTKINVYKYDEKLYRYIIVESILISI